MIKFSRQRTGSFQQMEDILDRDSKNIQPICFQKPRKQSHDLVSPQSNSFGANSKGNRTPLSSNTKVQFDVNGQDTQRQTQTQIVDQKSPNIKSNNTTQRDQKNDQWLEDIKNEAFAQTEFIRNIFQKQENDKSFRNLSANQKQSNGLTSKAFLHPRASVEKQKKKNKFSRAKNSFLNYYQDLFNIDGKQVIQVHPRGLDSILFQQLSANAIASRRWNSASTYQKNLYQLALSPQFPEYPLDLKDTKDLEKTKLSIKRQTDKHVIAYEEYQSPIKEYLKQYKEIQGQSKILYSTPFKDYEEILDYITKMKPGPDMIQQKLDQAQEEVGYIKDKGRSFTTSNQYRQPWVQEHLSPQKGKQQTFFTATPPKREVKIKQKPPYYDDDVYEVKPNRIQPTKVILSKRVFQEHPQKKVQQEYLYQKFNQRNC